MIEQACAFRNSRGVRLAATLLLPAAAGPAPAVAFAHGFGSSKTSPRNRTIAEALAARGVAALLFDFTGHGESEGDRDDSTLAVQTADLGAALDLLAAHPAIAAARLGVHGSSSGGSAAICRAAIDARVRALVLREPRSGGLEVEARRLRCPTLIVQGDRTPEVLAESRQLVGWLGCEKAFRLVRGASHLFAEPECFAVALCETVTWFVERL